MAVHLINGSVAVNKSCHQCRHPSASIVCCKNTHQNRYKVQQCAICYCRRCLRNRYGEKLELVSETSDWYCPKCRGICNCSICMKKRGYEPTGNLGKVTKLTGFRPVLEMLHNYPVCSNASQSSMPHSHKGLKRKHDAESYASENYQDKDMNILLEGDDKKENISPLGIEMHVNDQKDRKISMNGDDRKYISPLKKTEVVNRKNNLTGKGNNVARGDNLEIEKPEYYITRTLHNCVFPKGSGVTIVSNVEFSEDVVGGALQFLEFCSVFAKVLDLRKGQAESVLRELSRGLGRRGVNSTLVQFHIKLINMLHIDAGKSPLASTLNKDSGWLQALKSCIVDSKVVKHSSLVEMSMEFINMGISGYNEFDTSQKMQILNFLCDEMLNTELFRSLINKEKNEYIESFKKEAKQEKEFRFQKAMVPHNNNLPIPIIKLTEKAINDESSQAKKKQKPDVLGTESVLQDRKGGVFWRLKSCDSSIMLQEIKNWTSKISQDKWTFYNVDEHEEVEKKISFLKDSQPKPNRCRRFSPQIPSI